MSSQSFNFFTHNNILNRRVSVEIAITIFRSRREEEVVTILSFSEIERLHLHIRERGWE